MGNTTTDFILEVDIVSLQARFLRNGTRVETEDGIRYQVSDSDLGAGLLLASGNYANPLNGTIQNTGTETLIAGGPINQLRSAGPFLAPPANSVEEGGTLVAEVQDSFSGTSAVLNADGTDLFENNAGTDPQIEWSGPARISLTSNGVDTWSL